VVERAEFGFTRTKCGCEACSVNCRFVPGFLVEADLKRLIPASVVGDSDSLFGWVAAHLRASPGAIVVVSTAQGPVRTSIPTIVPARAADNMACHWLTDSGCAVHKNSPFGCAFFDAHTADVEAGLRSEAGIRSVAESWARGGLYALVWTLLHREGLVAPGPGESRKKMAAVVGSLYPATVPTPVAPEQP
jgi:hypothetical protein